MVIATEGFENIGGHSSTSDFDIYQDLHFQWFKCSPSYIPSLMLHLIQLTVHLI